MMRLNPFNILEGISKSAAPGRSPGFTEAHALKALEILSEERAGRAVLARRLGVGEGAGRTLIRHLKAVDLIGVDRGGIFLTEKGVSLLSRIRLHVSKGVGIHGCGHTVAGFNHAVLVKGMAGRIKLGVEQRDAALIAGARGATTLLYDGRDFRIPGLETGTGSELTELLVDELKPEAGDVVIIGSADSIDLAELGAKAAALELLKDPAEGPR